MNNLNVHELINIRTLDALTFLDYKIRINRRSWVGITQEILDALSPESTNHMVFVDNGRIIIYRDDYPFPHFVKIDDNRYLEVF